MISTEVVALAGPDPARRRWRGLPRWFAALGLVLAAAYAGQQVALQTGLSRLREAAEHRLDMLATGLEADLSRFDHLPALLEMTPVVPALLEAPADLQLRDTVSRYLNGVNGSVGAEMLYVLDPGGTSLAASDWDQPGTTIGKDLSFRPYVRDALQQGRGRFYGVGITSRKPGYYLSYALRRGERLRGLVAVKVNIEAAERAWRKLPGDVMLLDERGVVILSTRDDLKYRPLAPLDGDQRAEVQRSRPYAKPSCSRCGGPRPRASVLLHRSSRWTASPTSRRHARSRARRGSWSCSTAWRPCASRRVTRPSLPASRWWCWCWWP